MAFDISTAKDLPPADASASTPPTAADSGLTTQADGGVATASASPSENVSRATTGGFDIKSAMPLDSDFSITHLADKDMNIQHPANMPDHELISNLRDNIYAKDPVPAVPPEGQKGFIQAMTDKLQLGYGQSIAGIAHLVGLDKNKFMQDNVLFNQKEIDFFNKGTNTTDPYKQFGYHFAQGVGGLLSTLPLDIVTGGATKGFLLANVGARTAQILKFIPGFAIGAAARGAVQGAEEGASKGPVEAVSQAAQKGTENLVWGTLYGNVGPGVMAFPKMMALGAANATYEAAKQNRLPDSKELYTGVAEGLAYAAVFAPLGYLSGKSEVPVEKEALDAGLKDAHAAADAGDMEKAGQVYEGLINNKDIRPELRDGMKQIYDQTRSENLNQVQDLTKSSQEALNDTKPADNIVRDDQGKPIEIGSKEEAQPLPKQEAKPLDQTEKDVLAGEEETAPAKGSRLSDESGQVNIDNIPGVDQTTKAINDAGDFLKRSQEFTPKAKELADALNQIKTQRKADEIRAVQLLKSVDAKPEDYAAIYKYADNMEVFGEPKDATLTPDQEKIYNETLKPLQKASDDIFKKLRDLGFPAEKSGHLPREVEGKGGILDRIRAGAKNYGQGSILNKSFGGLKKRTMNALVSESGNRVVVSIKGGQVVAYQEGVATDLGKLDIQKNKEILKDSIAPIQKRIDRFKNELDVLRSVKTRSPISLGRLSQLREKATSIKEFLQRDDQKPSEAMAKVHDALQSRIDTLENQFKSLENEKDVLTKYDRGELTDRVEKLADQMNDIAEKQLNLNLSDLYEKTEDYIKQFSGEDKANDKAAAKLRDTLKEIKILSEVKSADDVVLTRQRMDTLEKKIATAAGQIFARSGDFKDEELADRFFVDKNNKKWKITDATTAEIEANTNLTYHKNPVLNVLGAYLKLRQIERASDFMEQLKESPEFGNIGVKFGAGTAIPDNWRGVDMPQFRGYAFEPRVADTLDSFYKKMKSGDDPIVNGLSAINGFLRSAIFFNPAIHIPNISVHWAVNRGIAKWFMPKEYITLASTATKAIEAVFHQNSDYLEMLDKGANLLYHDVAGDKVHDLMLKKMGEELETNGPLRDNIAKALGYVDPRNLVKAIYDFSGKATWSVNDIATMQAVYEEMNHGRSMEEAITEVGKHIPNYRMPARILDSKLIGDIMSNPNLTMFGAYHYGALKSYGEMIKSLVDVKGNPKGSAESLDKLAMLGLIGFVIYPALDNVAKTLTGNQDASFRRAGATTFPYNTYQMLKGKMDFTTWLFSIATPAPLLKSGVEVGLNRNLFTGKPVVQSRETMLHDLGNYAKSQVSPVAQVEKVTSGKQTGKEAALGLIGIKSPHHIAHTDAEQEAMNIMHTKNFGGPEMSDAQREKYQLKQSLSAGYAKTHDQSELTKYVESGDITKREKKEIIKDADLSPIERMTKRMSVEEVQKVFSKATADEKKSLIPVLQKKIDNRIKLVPEQQREKLRQLKASITAQ